MQHVCCGSFVEHAFLLKYVSNIMALSYCNAAQFTTTANYNPSGSVNLLKFISHGLIVVFILFPCSVPTRPRWMLRPPPTASPWWVRRSLFSATWTSFSSPWLPASSFIGSCPARSPSPFPNSRSSKHREYPSVLYMVFIQFWRIKGRLRKGRETIEPLEHKVSTFHFWSIKRSHSIGVLILQIHCWYKVWSKSGFSSWNIIWEKIYWTHFFFVVVVVADFGCH